MPVVSKQEKDRRTALIAEHGYTEAARLIGISRVALKSWGRTNGIESPFNRFGQTPTTRFGLGYLTETQKTKLMLGARLILEALEDVPTPDPVGSAVSRLESEDRLP